MQRAQVGFVKRLSPLDGGGGCSTNPFERINGYFTHTVSRPELFGKRIVRRESLDTLGFPIRS